MREIADWLDEEGATFAHERALFWAYAASELADDTRFEAAIDAAYAAASRAFARPGLSGGLAGTAWVFAHVASDGAAEFLADVDTRLLEHLVAWTADHDLMSGLAGLALYFRERAHTDGLALAIAKLRASAERTADGVRWRTLPGWLPESQRTRWPDGYYSCGVAHGSPGVIGVLSRAGGADDLVTAAVAELACCRGASERFYPNMVDADRRWLHVNRTGWCNGDLGISAALALAAPAHARELADACVSRPHAAFGVDDAALCHGAAGVAHLWNRWFQATGEHAFADAARVWIERALAMRHADGRFVRTGDVPVRGAMYPHPFLEGYAGIGLALLAALGDVEPAWDRLLLADF